MGIFNHKGEDFPRYALFKGNLKYCFCNRSKKKSSQKLSRSVALELDQRNEYSPFGACMETGTN